MARSGDGKKTTGWTLTIVGGLFTLGALNNAVTRYNLNSSHDVSKLVGGLGVSVLILAFGVALLSRKA